MARVQGECRICGSEGILDPYHIIPTAYAKKIGRKDLIDNAGNVVHICGNCHDMTTASRGNQHLLREEARKARRQQMAGSKFSDEWLEQAQDVGKTENQWSASESLMRQPKDEEE